MLRYWSCFKSDYYFKPVNFAIGTVFDEFEEDFELKAFGILLTNSQPFLMRYSWFSSLVATLIK
jgi:hypothetical protein